MTLTEDVAVIGASATGLYTAGLLASQGVRVRVFERASEIGQPARSLIATSALRDILGDLVEPAIRNEIRRFDLHADGLAVSVPLRRADVVVERTVLISELRRWAKESGAEVMTGRRFIGMRGDEDGLAIQLGVAGRAGTETVNARVVIGADGAFSRVARAGGWPQQPTVPLIQAVVELTDPTASSVSKVWFRPEDTPYFYWLIPDGGNTGVLGVIGERPEDLKPRLERFVRAQGFDVLDYQAARIPAYRRWIPVHRRIAGGDVFLVGDAAGHVKVSTVGGLVTGFRGARAVAHQIVYGSARGPLAALRRELNLHSMVRRSLHRFTEADYCDLLRLVDTRVRRELASYDRDDSLRLLAHVCRAQPRLAALGFRSLLSRDGARNHN